MPKLSDYTTNTVFVNREKVLLSDTEIVMQQNETGTMNFAAGNAVDDFDEFFIEYGYVDRNGNRRELTRTLTKQQLLDVANVGTTYSLNLATITDTDPVYFVLTDIQSFTQTSLTFITFIQNQASYPTASAFVSRISGIKYSEGGGGAATNVAQFSVGTDTGDLVDAPNFISVDANPNVGEVTIRHNLNKAVWPTATAYSLSVPYVAYMSAIDFNTFTLTNALLNGQAADGVINVTLVW